LHRLKGGKIKAEVTKLSKGSNLKMGVVILHLNRRGAEILKWVKTLSPIYSRENVIANTVSNSSSKSTFEVTSRNIYIARIGRGDHYNSKGYRLGNMKSILRQDRAYFYKGIGDEEDRPDHHFRSKKSRVSMEYMKIRPIGISYSKLRNLILHHNPLIKVHINNKFLDIKVLEQDQPKPTAP